MRAARVSRAAVLAVVLSAAGAGATPTYPATIAADLGLKQQPPQQCALCHKNNKQDASAVITPFALSMKARGLVEFNEGSLQKALTKLEADAVDSDGDGITDVAELRSGDDPNVVGGKTGGLPPPRYGCGAEAVPGSMVVLAVLALSRLVHRRSGGSTGTP